MGGVQCVFYEIGDRQCVGRTERAHLGAAEGTRVVSRIHVHPLDTAQ